MKLGSIIAIIIHMIACIMYHSPTKLYGYMRYILYKTFYQIYYLNKNLSKFYPWSLICRNDIAIRFHNM